MNTNLSYTKKWAALRRLQFAFWTIFVSSIPALVTVQRVTESGSMRLSVAGAFVAAWLALLAAWVVWRCPRCEQFFHMDMIAQNPLSSECRHCGLEKGAES